MAAVVDAPGTETPVVDAPAPATAPANGAAPAEPSWRDSLPDDLKGAAWLSKYKTPEDALRGFAEAQKLIGSKLSVPKDDAPKEEWDKFYASLGRPEAPDKYDLGVPEMRCRDQRRAIVAAGYILRAAAQFECEPERRNIVGDRRNRKWHGHCDGVRRRCRFDLGAGGRGDGSNP